MKSVDLDSELSDFENTQNENKKTFKNQTKKGIENTPLKKNGTPDMRFKANRKSLEKKENFETMDIPLRGSKKITSQKQKVFFFKIKFHHVLFLNKTKAGHFRFD